MPVERLIPAHGGYRKLKSFHLAQLLYDVTVRFCNCYIERGSRTRDQMIQAARSGAQNISEGSQVSGTSKKSELKLTNVARGSLEELRRDYEDFLRQRGFEEWLPNHPALVRFKRKRCATLDQFRAWIKEERALSKARTHTDKHGRHTGLASSAQLAANGALSLLNLCCYLLDQQLESQANAFLEEGGFTERLYRLRTRRRTAQARASAHARR